MRKLTIVISKFKTNIMNLFYSLKGGTPCYFSSRSTGLTITSLILMIAFGCKKSDNSPPPTAPVVTTTALTNITTSSAVTGGTIVTNGNATITQSGIVWSKVNTTPTLTDSVMAGTTASGSFTTNLTGLDFNRTYYIRAFATNSVGTGYGDVVTLNTTNDTSKVRFTYNGKEVIYGIIVSPTSGKKWLDRNLGAKQVATSFNDYQAYGDLFQWGRQADGHQLMNWTNSTAGTGVNGTTNVLATTDIPGHSNFILAPDNASSLADWRSDNNRNRWVTAPQGPCPAGWHVPTLSEWAAEVPKTIWPGTATSGGITNRNTAYNLLKLTVAGYRRGLDNSEGGTLGGVGDRGYYWSSSDQKQLDPFTVGDQLLIATTYVQIDVSTKSTAFCVRCIIN
jgi:uncharacterized protein (TIGR02145 family)